MSISLLWRSPRPWSAGCRTSHGRRRMIIALTSGAPQPQALVEAVDRVLSACRT
jgi:hypothetical protein